MDIKKLKMEKIFKNMDWNNVDDEILSKTTYLENITFKTLINHFNHKLRLNMIYNNKEPDYETNRILFIYINKGKFYFICKDIDYLSLYKVKNINMKKVYKFHNYDDIQSILDKYKLVSKNRLRELKLDKLL